MKRIICLFVCLSLLLPCCGCKKVTEQSEEGICFYYLRTQLSYQTDRPAIEGEKRQIQQLDSWAQVLDVYLAGPESEDLVSPFPAGLRVLKTVMENGTVHISVSKNLADLTGLELTIACACLAMTCLELTGAETVVISPEEGLLDGQKSITMDKNTLLLIDMAEGE